MKERVPVSEINGFAKFKRKVDLIEREGNIPPQELQEMKARLVEWDKRIFHQYKGWRPNFPHSKTNDQK